MTPGITKKKAMVETHGIFLSAEPWEDFSRPRLTFHLVRTVRPWAGLCHGLPPPKKGHMSSFSQHTKNFLQPLPETP
jgi:hypothetical protein